MTFYPLKKVSELAFTSHLGCNVWAYACMAIEQIKKGRVKAVEWREGTLDGRGRAVKGAVLWAVQEGQLIFKGMGQTDGWTDGQRKHSR